jgi:hypothetical protein
MQFYSECVSSEKYHEIRKHTVNVGLIAVRYINSGTRLRMRTTGIKFVIERD